MLALKRRHDECQLTSCAACNAAQGVRCCQKSQGLGGADDVGQPVVGHRFQTEQQALRQRSLQLRKRHGAQHCQVLGKNGWRDVGCDGAKQLLTMRHRRRLVLPGAVRRGGAHELVDVGPCPPRVAVEEHLRSDAGPREPGRVRFPGARVDHVMAGPDVADGHAGEVAQRQKVADGGGGAGQDPELGGEAGGAEQVGLAGAGRARDPVHEGSEVGGRGQLGDVGAARDPHVT